MGLRVFALCRETQLEVDSSDLGKDLTAEYTLCLEDIAFTMVPALLICSILPFTKSVWTLTLSSTERSRRLAAWLLCAFPLLELLLLVLTHKAHAATYIYASAEVVAWGLASAYDAGKSSARNVSWVWKGLWILLAFAGALRLATRLVIAVIDGLWSLTLLLHAAKTGLAIGVVYAWLPTRRPLSEFEGHNSPHERITHESSRTKWVVTLVLLNSQVVYGLAVLTLPNYAMSLHAGPMTIGVVFGAYSLAILVSSSAFSNLSRRLGRVRLVSMGCVCLAAATLLFASAGSVEMLVLSRTLQGLAAAASFVPALALLTDATAPRNLGETLGEVTGWSGLGMLVGPPLGAALCAWQGYSLPFLIGAGSSLLVAGTVVLTLSEPPQRQTEDQPPTISKAKCGAILGVIALGAAVLTMLEPILPILLKAKFNATQLQMGAVFALTVVVFGAMSPIAGRISDRAGRVPVLTSGMLFLGSALPVMAIPNSLYIEAACLVVIGASMALTMVPTLPELADQVRKQGLDSYESVYSLFNASYAVGSIAGPVLGGLAVHLVGFQTGLMAFAVVVVAYSMGLGWGDAKEEGKLVEV